MGAGNERDTPKEDDIKTLILITIFAILLLFATICKSAEIIVNDSADQYIVGVPSNNGAWYDGTNYWIFYQEATTMKCQFGPSLGNMSQTGGSLDTLIHSDGRAYSVVFGRVGSTNYAWVVWNSSSGVGVIGNYRRYELTSTGLANVVNGSSGGASAFAGFTFLAYDYGSDVVTTLYYSSHEVNDTPADSGTYQRAVPQLVSTADTGMSGYNPAALNVSESMRIFKLADGFVNVAMDEGDAGTNTRGVYERSKVLVGDAWGGESINLIPAGGMSFATGTSPHGQMDMCQLDDGRTLFAYCREQDLDHGSINVFMRGNLRTNNWSNVVAGLIGSTQAWHIAMTTDGTNVWLFYVKDVTGTRDTAIYYKVGIPTATGIVFGPEIKLADMQATYTFERMTTQLRARDKIVVIWSEKNGADYDLVAQDIDISGFGYRTRRPEAMRARYN